MGLRDRLKQAFNSIKATGFTEDDERAAKRIKEVAEETPAQAQFREEKEAQSRRDALAREQRLEESLWNTTPIVKTMTTADIFDHPRQLSVVNMSVRDGHVTRLDEECLRVMKSLGKKGAELRVVMKYGGLITFWKEMPEIEQIVARVTREKVA